VVILDFSASAANGSFVLFNAEAFAADLACAGEDAPVIEIATEAQRCAIWCDFFQWLIAHAARSGGFISHRQTRRCAPADIAQNNFRNFDLKFFGQNAERGFACHRIFERVKFSIFY
jgi:hypothetical protein